MVYNTILLRYGEIFLKGKNKAVFERKLVDNIRKITHTVTGIKPSIINSRGRVLMKYFPKHTVLRQVFGLVSYSPAVRVEKITEEIQKKALELLSKKKGTFRIATKRSDKLFPITSPEFNRIVGGHVEKHTALLFSSGAPDIILEIEINQEGAYLFFETIACFGGLPTGVEGRALLLMEDQASVLAGLLFMKRGCSVIPIGYTKQDISLLQQFSPSSLDLRLVADVTELDDFAKNNNISILISGQRLENMQKYETGLLIMRPLIAYNTTKIREDLHKFKD